VARGVDEQWRGEPGDGAEGREDSQQQRAFARGQAYWLNVQA
jgi:hypothetical protein